MNIKLGLLFIFVTAFCIYGCTSNYPVDLKVASVIEVARSDIGEIIGGDVDLPIIEHWTSSDFLKIEVSTKENLIHYAINTDATLNADAHFCDVPEAVVLLGVPNIYVSGRSVPNVTETEEIEASRDNLFVYDVVLFVSWGKERDIPEALRKSKDQLIYLQYDLKKTPLDICLSVRGGNMVNSYSSNEVRISKLKIQNALLNNE